jgi:hypothetical protein
VYSKLFVPVYSSFLTFLSKINQKKLILLIDNLERHF